MKSPQPRTISAAITDSIAAGAVIGDVPDVLIRSKRVLGAIAREYNSAISFSTLSHKNHNIDIVSIYTNSADFVYYVANLLTGLGSFIMICPYLNDDDSEDSYIIGLRLTLGIIYRDQVDVVDAGRTLVSFIGDKDKLEVFTKIYGTYFESIHLQFRLLPKRGLNSNTDVISKEQKRDEAKADEVIDRWLAEIGIPPESRSGLIAKFRIEIARTMRPKWAGRLKRGGELATISAPLFLRHVHAEDIAQDGTVHKETIRAIDPELMDAVESYISKRKKSKDLGDAEGLIFVLSRPSPPPSAPASLLARAHS
jgi:hypothetical protein